MLPLILQIAGIVAVTIGVGLIFLPLGIIVGGVAAFGIGLIYDQDRR